MRLKFYLIGAMAMLIAGQSFGQSNSADKYKPLYKIAPNDAPRDPKRDYSVNSSKDIVFTGDFSEDENWIINNEGEQGTWEIVTQVSPDVEDFLGIMESATADNGFAQFDAIQFLLSPDDVDVQNSVVEWGGDPIDCSNLDEVVCIFNQRYRAFNIDQTALEVSVDGGNTWLTYTVNEDVVTNDPAIQGELVVDIGQQAAGESDVRIRFRWTSDAPTSAPDWTQEEENSFGAGYAWLIDDVLVGAPLENNLVVGNTYYDDWYKTFFFNADSNAYEFASDATTDEDITSSFEYHTMPDWNNRPFNFAAIVSNEGLAQQTGVILEVTFTPPTGDPEVFFSDPITMEPGDVDTIEIAGVMPNAWMTPEDGAYVMDYVVFGDQEEQLPGNNVGVSRITRITSSSQDEGAIAMHGNSSTINLVAGNQQDLIIGTRYNFDEDEAERVITEIEFALGDETADNGIGQIILLNMRNEGVGVTNDGDGVGYTENAIFPYEPQDGIVYAITDETPFTTGSDPNWISVLLPNPVLIDPNTVYQAEMLLLPYGSDAVFTGYTSSREPGITVFYDEPSSANPSTWGFAGTFHANLRFRTEEAINVNNVSYESGIKLTQNYPNPVVDNTRIQFQLDETSPVTFQVFDISGRLVFSEDLGNIPATTAHTIEFNREGFASGTYTYSVVTENDRLTRKMIIE